MTDPAGAASSAAIGTVADPQATDDTGSWSVVSLLKRIAHIVGIIRNHLPAAVGGRVPVQSTVPYATSVTIRRVQTAADGTSWVPFPATACTQLDVVNTTGVTIVFRRNGAGDFMSIAPDTARMIIGITNADQIQVRRADLATVLVTVEAEAFVG